MEMLREEAGQSHFCSLFTGACVSHTKCWATPRARSQGPPSHLGCWAAPSHLPSSPEPGPRPAFPKFPLSPTSHGSWVGGPPAWLGRVEYVVSKRGAVWPAQRPGGEESERVIAA